MKKLRGMIGLPVVETETGIQIGEVVEVVLDIEEAKICGFVVAEEKWFATTQALPFADVFSLGRDAIMVRNQHVIQHLSTILMKDNPYYLRDLFDKQIFTDAGLCLGVLVDISFDNTTGELKWYQVSDSIVTDLLYGRMIMPLPPTQIIGTDKVIIPEAMARLLQTETETETQIPKR
jgi:uncharacterized protein YrrD